MANNKKDNPTPEQQSPMALPQEYKIVSADYGYQYDEDEIDLLELAKTIWSKRMFIVKVIALGAVIGVIAALLSPKEYKSAATLMPEYSTESQGGASSLLRQYGGLLGVSGGSYTNNSNAIRVDLYPNIVQSTNFQLKLMDQPFYFSDINQEATLFDYYTELNSPGVLGVIKSYTIGLPGKILGAILPKKELMTTVPGEASESMVLNLSKEEFEVISTLRQKITASLDEESGIVSVSVTLPDNVAAAAVTEYTIKELTEYLTEYRTEKVLRDLTFVEEQLATAKARFEEAQLTLAEFRDSNQGMLSARAQTEEQRLNSEYQIAFNLYNGLTQQYEEAKLKVQEETPVFKTLEAVQVPLQDETSGAMILIVFIMLSGIGSIGWIFVHPLIEQFKNAVED
ncbi:Wzz/FepE/Etk N-terminal domain-containing protein [Balneolaceae bacterium]|nr:Wzz/FepE/Etk N-terminal domain-containing protein [Balneolaceae bacterium]